MKTLTVYHAGNKSTTDVYKIEEEPEFNLAHEQATIPHTGLRTIVPIKIYKNNKGHHAVKTINELREPTRLFEIIYWSGRRVTIGGNVSYKLDEHE